jgi:hypothetical protein
MRAISMCGERNARWPERRHRPLDKTDEMA